MRGGGRGWRRRGRGQCKWWRWVAAARRRVGWRRRTQPRAPPRGPSSQRGEDSWGGRRRGGAGCGQAHPASTLGRPAARRRRGPPWRRRPAPRVAAGSAAQAPPAGWLAGVQPASGLAAAGLRPRTTSSAELAAQGAAGVAPTPREPARRATAGLAACPPGKACIARAVTEDGRLPRAARRLLSVQEEDNSQRLRFWSAEPRAGTRHGDFLEY